jgi:hypothetical protein
MISESFDPFTVRHKNDLIALTLINKFQWLRAQELGYFLWPDTKKNGHKQALRAAKSWLQRGLLIERKLPDQCGTGYFLASAGVRFLFENGVENAFTGKDIGILRDGKWLPPSDWRHHLLIVGVACRLQKMGYKIISEYEIRRNSQALIKIPDLVAFYEDRVIWIEAEQSKKSGVRNMKPLAQALLLAASGKMSEVLGLKPVEAAIIFDIDSHSNHSARVRKAISEYSKKTINLHLIECKIIRHGVAEINIKTETIEPSSVLKVLRTLDAEGWKKSDCGTYFTSHYAGTKVTIENINNEYQNDWYIELNDEGRGMAPNKSEAKMKAALSIAQFLGL